MPEDTQETGLKTTTIAFMGVVALFFDALNALFNLALVYWLVTIFAYLTFFLWFRMHNISFWKPKRLLTAGGSFIIELIPVISILPAITAAVIVVALDAKVKDILPIPLANTKDKPKITQVVGKPTKNTT